ncbi:MAG: hypothetical protein AAGI68_00045 [Planctomycetota bacterium]
MQAAATIPPLTDTVPIDSTLAEAVLFVDGIPHPTARVIELSIAYPTDRREALIEVVPTPIVDDDPATRRTTPTPTVFPAIQTAASAVLARPIILTGLSQVWQVLCSGRLILTERLNQASSIANTYRLQDRFAEALTNTPPPESRTALQAATASHEALHRLAEVAGLPIDLTSIENQPLTQPLDALQTLDSLFEQILLPNRLHLRLHRTLQSDRLTELLAVVPDRFAPLHRPGAGSRHFVTSASTHTEPQPILLTAAGQPRRTESSFMLQPGFSAELMSQADSYYSPNTSPDWPTYAPVFRSWALNEDHADPNGTAFDLAAFFNDPQVTPTPLRFNDCLTLDTAGRPLPPQLETSYDGGTSYTLSSAGFEVASDRAAITLTDPTLPPALLTAARSQQLRLRLTASLTSPRLTEQTRFRGNPFLNPTHATTLRHPDLRFDSLHPDSIHAQRVATGALQSDTQDDSSTLRSRLIDALTDSPSQARSSRTQLKLAGTDLAYHPGDRIRIDDATHRITRIRCRFDHAQTELTLTPG